MQLRSLEPSGPISLLIHGLLSDAIVEGTNPKPEIDQKALANIRLTKTFTTLPKGSPKTYTYPSYHQKQSIF